MAKSPTSALDKIVSEYQQKLDAIVRIRDLVSENPGIAKQLVAALTESNGSPKPTRRSSRKTHFETMQTYFEEKNNQWASAPKIMEDTGLNRGQVSYVLYKSPGNRFERKRGPKAGRGVLWRLRSE